MIGVSARFLETVRGSHRAVARVTLVDGIQYGASPTGLPVPILAGSVRMSAGSDVKAQLRLTVPGDWWDEFQPFGAEVFAERGVAFGDGQEEYAPLGYYPVGKPNQDSAPYGPIDTSCDDRMGRLIKVCRIVIPWQIPAGTTHRQILERLVNGDPSGVGTYGMYRLQGATAVPIIWTDAGYNPDTATVDSLPVVEDSAYEYLAKLVGARGALLRFRPTGELEIVASSPPVDAPAVYRLSTGPASGATLKRWSRSTDDDGVYNVVRATGSDPQHQTGLRVARITEPGNPLRYDGPMGPRIRYLASPLLSTDAEADQAAATLLARSTGLPVETQLWTVPMPAHQPLDVVAAPSGSGIGTFVLDEVEVPLVGGGETALKTRTLNPVAEVETPESPEPTPPPDPGPGTTPDPGSGPTPGGGDPSDGTQAAVLLGWGPKIDGDEFVGNVIDTSKWGLYNGAGHTGNGTRRPAAFSQHDGMLTITGDNNDQSGGAAFRRGSNGYRVEFRVRAYRDGSSAGRNDDYHPVLILWPDSDQWPEGAEYDIVEFDVGDASLGGYMHLPNHTPYRQDHFTFNGDATQWFNMACEWNRNKRTLKAWFNGTQVYNGSGRVAEAPGPMHPTFQLDHFGGKPRRAKFDMAWIRVYGVPT
jgi:uncharacterized protein DUF5047